VGFAELLAAVDVTALDILGGGVTYTPTGGPAADVEGIFDAAYVRVEAGEAGMSSVGPALFCRSEDLPSDPDTDLTATVTVGGVVYRVREAQPDGLGGLRLYLHRAV
jgi:hypothetical protein